MTDPKPEPTQSKHELRSAAMQTRICDAAIHCLDAFGYAETTLARIQSQAQVSRGAIMYHYADRHEIIAATAVRLLNQSLRPIEKRVTPERNESLRSLLREIWERVVNTSGGKAMLEILVACRTDTALKAALATQLQDWDLASRQSISEVYSGSGPEPDDAEILWSIARSFVRGLIIHQQFISNPETIPRMLDRFADLMEPHLLTEK